MIGSERVKPLTLCEDELQGREAGLFVAELQDPKANRRPPCSLKPTHRIHQELGGMLQLLCVANSG